MPVVATATGCVPDVVTDGVNGAIVAGCPGDLAAGLQRVPRAPDRATRRAARATAEQHSWREVARRYVAVMTVLDDRPGAE